MDLLNGFAIEMRAIVTPGVVRSRRLRQLGVMIESFDIHDFSLAGGCVKDGES